MLGIIQTDLLHPFAVEFQTKTRKPGFNTEAWRWFYDADQIAAVTDSILIYILSQDFFAIAHLVKGLSVSTDTRMTWKTLSSVQHAACGALSLPFTRWELQAVLPGQTLTAWEWMFLLRHLRILGFWTSQLQLHTGDRRCWEFGLVAAFESPPKRSTVYWRTAHIRRQLHTARLELLRVSSTLSPAEWTVGWGPQR